MNAAIHDNGAPDPTACIIREAVPGEAAAIIDLQRRAFAEAAERYGDWSLPPLIQTVAEMVRVFDTSTVLVAMKGGMIAGSVRACDQGGVCTIARLIVEPSLQGQGIGSALLIAIEARFPKAYRFELHTGHKSTRNLSLYETHGYRRIREEPVHATLTLVHMAKDGPGAQESP